MTREEILAEFGRLDTQSTIKEFFALRRDNIEVWREYRSMKLSERKSQMDAKRAEITAKINQIRGAESE